MGRGRFGGSAAAVLALVALNSLKPSPWASLAEDGVSAAAVAAIWVGLFRRGRWGGRPWVYVGLGMTAWVVGDLVWDGYAVAGLVRPDVSFADLFYLAGYPLLAFGLYEMAPAAAGRHRPRRAARRRDLRRGRRGRGVAAPRGADRRGHARAPDRGGVERVPARRRAADRGGGVARRSHPGGAGYDHVPAPRRAHRDVRARRRCTRTCRSSRRSTSRGSTGCTRSPTS